MSSKEEILDKIRASVKERFDKPSFDDIEPLVFEDPVTAFIDMTFKVGGKAAEIPSGGDVNAVIRDLFPQAGSIASNLPEVNIATLNPDTVDGSAALAGADVGIVSGTVGVAENGCVPRPPAVSRS